MESAARKLGADLQRRRAEDKFRVLFENSSRRAWVSKGGRIIDCNQAFIRLLGYSSKEEVLGLEPSQFSPEFQPDGRRSDKLLAGMEELARRKGGHSFEWWHRRPDGGLFVGEVNLTPSILGDEQVMLAVIRDISDRKAYEEQLERAKDAAESANQAKSDFLATMTHEIRTPLNGVLSMAVLLLESSLTSEQRRMLNAIRSSGRFLLSMVNDILDLAKIEAGRMAIEPAAFDLRLSAEDVAALLAPKAEAKGIDLVLRYSPRLPRRVVGDSGRIRQILLHLGDNGVKFTGMAMY